MLKKAMLSSAFLLSTTSGFAHHAACVDDPQGLMTCGAHSGRVNFNLKNFGPITTNTNQVVLCNSEGAQVESLKFSWVESEDSSKHFEMGNMKFHNLGEGCVLIGPLNFTPHTEFSDAPMNAWKLEIRIPNIPVPSYVYVEAVAPKE